MASVPAKTFFKKLLIIQPITTQRSWLESTPNHPIPVQSTQAHRLLFRTFQKVRSNICHPATKLPFFQSALQARVLLQALSLPSFPNCLSGFVCLPVTDAVRVQLYRIASSPNTFPGPMVHNFLPCLVISTVPSVHKHQKTFQWIPRLWSEGNAVNGKEVCEGGRGEPSLTTLLMVLEALEASAWCCSADVQVRDWLSLKLSNRLMEEGEACVNSHPFLFSRLHFQTMTSPWCHFRTRQNISP